MSKSDFGLASNCAHGIPDDQVEAPKVVAGLKPIENFAPRLSD